ncbi:double zinc ribbon domain-containing protein [Haloferax sp. DFSO60]|uniref:double zinc ribbon domain-containing protein n=1 Tax=Haloferax sp. DFSO60 TaxID=3388652 RepID=UPI0039786918
MSKITFRADDELVERLDALDSSKSEVMREALRTYLDGAEREILLDDEDGDEPSDLGEALESRVDELVAARVTELLPKYLDETREERPEPSPTDVNVNISVDGVPQNGVNAERDSEGTTEMTSDSERKTTSPTAETDCGQCGESVNRDHVYCPNCGEKASHRVFCECGDELRSDWAFCPGCGRRTPAADVLEKP